MLGMAACGTPVRSPTVEVADPAEAEFDSERLEDLSEYLREAGSSALVIVHDGRVVYEWGETRRRHTVHSIRKALLNSLIGIEVDRGTIDTTATLAQLGIDDVGGLTEREKQARVADLLRSRSGVYHPAAAVSEAMAAGQPPRGAHAPGEAFYYNNWDFNVLGAIYEQATGRSLYDGFRQDIAGPLGMRHYQGRWTRIRGDEGIPDTDGFYQLEPDRSRYPAYHFRMSALDLALYGQLYLDHGRWQDREIVPADWVQTSTRAYSSLNPEYGIGYGMLWYVRTPTDEGSTRSFYHTGAGVHMLGVYPGSDLVFVHRVDTEAGADFQQNRLYRIIGMIFGAMEPTP